jgi:hypothetical protein
MAASADPLLRLVRNEGEVNREHLARLLDGRVGLDPERGAFGFRHGVRDRLNKRERVLVALLAQKALHLIDGKQPEALKPADIERLTGIPGNTLRPILKVLSDKGITRRDDEGAHYVASYGLEAAEQMLTEREE